MNQPTTSCPHCKAEIALTESLAAPLIRAIRAQYQKKIAEKEAEVGRRENAIRAQRAELAKAVESAEQQLTARLKTERERIAAEEATKAQLQLALPTHPPPPAWGLSARFLPDSLCHPTLAKQADSGGGVSVREKSL